MATATRRRTRTIGPDDHGRRMPYEQFIRADFEDGWLYELARGVIEVTEVPAPEHGMIVGRIARTFVLYEVRHPGVIAYRAGGGECRLRLPGMESDRHPDQAVYLTPAPSGKDPWARWTPEIVVEVVSKGGENRDYFEKREDYLRAGVREYWILDPIKRQLLALCRDGDVWAEATVPAGRTYRTRLLPGLVVRSAEWLGPARKRGR